jgi:hypothetical protein
VVQGDERILHAQMQKEEISTRKDRELRQKIRAKELSNLSKVSVTIIDTIILTNYTNDAYISHIVYVCIGLLSVCNIYCITIMYHNNRHNYTE